MRTADRSYRPAGTALLRAAVATSEDVPAWFPDPDDEAACRSWLSEAWSPWLAAAVRQASSSLAEKVEEILAGREVGRKDVRRSTLAMARYVLRAVGRPTPFGLFAGVAPVSFGPAGVRWGNEHRVAARADTQWLADVVDALETRPDVVDQLRVVLTTQALRRGGWLEALRGQDRVRVRETAAVSAALEAAESPVRLGEVAVMLTRQFGVADEQAARAMLVELLRQGVLISELRAPMTVVDPLGHLVDRLCGTGVDESRELKAIHGQLADAPAEGGDALAAQMRLVSSAGRSPLAVDLLLDAEVTIPERLGAELAGAAQALLHLSRFPAGQPVWREYHAAFCERYGVGTLVRLADVLNPDTGLGYPASYPGSVLPVPADATTERDQRLLALAWQAAASGGREVILTDEVIRQVAGGPMDDWSVPPHIELAARIHAASASDLQRGDYTMTVSPARAGGVLTSRFTATMTGSGLEEVYRDLPTAVAGALPAQLSFPPAYPHAENVSRIPAYLPHVISLGEHRTESAEVIPLSDLAVTATRGRLFLVSMSRNRVVEPQVFHALALEKQAPPLARFLAHLPRAFSAAWTVLDWGPLAARLPYLPRMVHGRSILTPARWRLTAADLSPLARWQERWDCPDAVDLREDDRTLRLNLAEPLHQAILTAHIARHGHAILAEPSGNDRWLNGHAHEIAVPLIATRPSAPNPLPRLAPLLASTHGQLPGGTETSWLYAKLHAHPERHDEIITDRLPALSASSYWYLRYRGRHDPDHLRIRIWVAPGEYGQTADIVGKWAAALRQDGLASRLVFDTYAPEIGRYGGTSSALAAAEDVFIADSRVAAAALRHPPAEPVDRVAIAAAGMVDIVRGLHGDQAMPWLLAQPAPANPAPTSRTAAYHATRLVLHGRPTVPAPVEAARSDRAAALAAYRRRLPPSADLVAITESLLHLHHNRVLGINPDTEATARRLARRVAVVWKAQQPGTANAAS